MKKQINNEKEILKLISDGAMPLTVIAKKARVSLRTLYYWFDLESKYIKAFEKRNEKQGK